MNSALTDTVESMGTVLVVDDDLIICQLTCHMLRDLGWTVRAVHDGREAVDIYRAEADRITLVVSDVMMPRMSGYEVFAEIRRIRPDARVILTSGCGETEAISSLEGLSGFLAKPFHMNELREALCQALAAPKQAETSQHAQ